MHYVLPWFVIAKMAAAPQPVYFENVSERNSRCDGICSARNRGSRPRHLGHSIAMGLCPESTTREPFRWPCIAGLVCEGGKGDVRTLAFTEEQMSQGCLSRTHIMIFNPKDESDPSKVRTCIYKRKNMGKGLSFSETCGATAISGVEDIKIPKNQWSVW